MEKKTGRILLAVQKLAPNTRRLLSTKRVSWIESETGICHLVAPNTVLKDVSQASDSNSARAKLIDRSGLVAEIILASFRNAELRLATIAERARVAIGLVSRIFARLSAMNILTYQGSGPHRSWRLQDPGGLLDLWSSEERRPHPLRRKATALAV
jgi:hypothetical protein